MSRLLPLLIGVFAAFGALTARRFLLVDQCLDRGGRWDDAARRCVREGGTLELPLSGFTGLVLAGLVGLLLAVAMWRLWLLLRARRSMPPTTSA